MALPATLPLLLTGSHFNEMAAARKVDQWRARGDARARH